MTKDEMLELVHKLKVQLGFVELSAQCDDFEEFKNNLADLAVEVNTAMSDKG